LNSAAICNPTSQEMKDSGTIAVWITQKIIIHEGKQ